MIYIDSYAYINQLEASPIEKFAFSLSVMAICLVRNSMLISWVVILLLASILIFKAKIPHCFYIKIMTVPALFLVLSTAAIIVTTIDANEQVLVSCDLLGNNLGITYIGVKNALILVSKSLGAVSCLYFLVLTTPMVQIISVLKKIKCPAIVVELMGLIYKFIFVLLETARRIYISQDARLGYSTFRVGYCSLSNLVSSLFIKSLRCSQALYTSLESRGYDGQINVAGARYKNSIVNISFIIIIDLLLIILSGMNI